MLELDGPSEVTRMRFYDIYWLEGDLTAAEREAYNSYTDENVHARTARYLREIGARCPLCRSVSPIADFRGSIRRAVCPRCHQTFAPEPGHLLQALYAQAGFDDLA